MSHRMYVIKHIFHSYLCYITFITHKNDVIISLSNFTEPTRLQLVPLNKNLTMIMISFSCVLMSHRMYVIKHIFHSYLCYITFITHKNDVIISLSNFTEPTRLQLVPLNKNLTMIMISFSCVINVT